MKLGIIIPCLNEADGLEEINNQLHALLKEMIENKQIDKDSFICYVDDGSTDETWSVIMSCQKKSSIVKGLKLSKNFGHQNALIAGLMRHKDGADALISMDADLQDDLQAIHIFVNKFKEGYEVIYGVRKNRTSDTVFKRTSATFFYSFQRFMGIDTVENHADYRLLSKRALNALAQFKEINLFLRGIVPMLGFRSCNIYYTREERFTGETKYPLKKMIFFALDGITSFSTVPLRLITIAGFFLFLLSLGGIGWVIVEKFILGNVVQGWASTMVSIYFIGGIQVMSLGIIGEYIGRNFQQSKARPRYIIDKEI